jgi:hypothetical protein
VKQNTKKGGVSLLVVFLVFVTVLGVGSYLVWQKYGDAFDSFVDVQKTSLEDLAVVDSSPRKNEDGKAAPTPTPKPTPHPILQGKETYSIGQSADARPKIRSAEVEPHDPKVGEIQTIKVRLVDTQPVQSAKITLASDNKTRDLELKLTEGNNLDGKWTVSWTVDDTVLYTYSMKIDAVGNGSQSTVTVSIR